jgi:hypothetical protein
VSVAFNHGLCRTGIGARRIVRPNLHKSLRIRGWRAKERLHGSLRACLQHEQGIEEEIRLHKAFGGILAWRRRKPLPSPPDHTKMRG